MTKAEKVILGGVGALAAFLGIKYLMKAAPELPYCCPYCGQCFATLAELQEHVASQHPGERIPIPIIWD